MGEDLRKLSVTKASKTPPDMPYADNMVEDWQNATHVVVANDGIQHECQLTGDVKLAGEFAIGFAAVQYPNGSVVAVLAD